MKTLIITHAKCNDGLSAAYILKSFLNRQGEEVTNDDIYPLSHTGNQMDDLEKAGFWTRLSQGDVDQIIVTDFSLHLEPLQLITMMFPKVSVVEIDHHKTALDRGEVVENMIDILQSRDKYTSFINMRMSGAVLTYIWCYHPSIIPLIDEWDDNALDLWLAEHVPSWVLYIQDRDIWKWKYNATSKAFCYTFMNRIRELKDFNQYNFYPYPLEDENNEDDDTSLVAGFIDMGMFGLEIEDNQINDLMKDTKPFSFTFNGVEYVGEAVNVNKFFTSEIGNRIAYKEGNNCALVFGWTGEAWKCGLRSRKDVDVSVVAQHFNGGGHAQAAGFTWRKSIEELLAILEKGEFDV